jgi:hypothetical protein
MSGVTNKHRIQVNARVKDESGGKAYAFALDKAATTTDIKLMIKRKKLTPEHMTYLGEFTSIGNDLSTEVTRFIAWDTVNSGTISFVNSLVNGDAYHMYIYAVDPFQNATVVANSQNPITMTTDTIVIQFSALQPERYAERRALNEPVLSIPANRGFFDFYVGNITMLYANLSVIPKESVVSDISVVAFYSEQINDQNVIAFPKDKRTLLVDDETMISTTHELGTTGIERFYTDTSDTTTGTLFSEHFAANGYGHVFHVYTVMRDVGFEKWIVRHDTVHAGTYPVLSNSTAEIEENVVV